MHESECTMNIHVCLCVCVFQGLLASCYPSLFRSIKLVWPVWPDIFQIQITTIRVTIRNDSFHLHMRYIAPFAPETSSLPVSWEWQFGLWCPTKNLSSNWMVVLNINFMSVVCFCSHTDAFQKICNVICTVRVCLFPPPVLASYHLMFAQSTLYHMLGCPRNLGSMVRISGL